MVCKCVSESRVDLGCKSMQAMHVYVSMYMQYFDSLSMYVYVDVIFFSLDLDHAIIYALSSQAIQGCDTL